ncbi:methyltransferase domain-containing protein [Escherichia coli]|nr:methyltransferase domain-containing protein [Escherichia coli]
MSDWNPSLYLHFAAERSRPAVELLARVPLENIEYIADLGCGPGNSTALLHQRWPAARITGIDSSPAMIAEARSALPDCLFVEADIRNWQPEQALDFLTRYHQMLEEQYPLQENGQILLAFPRLFIVARRTE